MTKGFTNHNTHDMQFINCPKYKMHICIEQTDINLISNCDVPRYEIIWQLHGEVNPRSETINLLNLIEPHYGEGLLLPKDVYDAFIEVYGVALKKEFKKYAKGKGWIDEID